MVDESEVQDEDAGIQKVETQDEIDRRYLQELVLHVQDGLQSAEKVVTQLTRLINKNLGFIPSHLKEEARREFVFTILRALTTFNPTAPNSPGFLGYVSLALRNTRYNLISNGWGLSHSKFPSQELPLSQMTSDENDDEDLQEIIVGADPRDQYEQTESLMVVENAIETACLSDRQASIVRLIAGGYGCSDVAVMLLLHISQVSAEVKKIRENLVFADALSVRIHHTLDEL